MHNFLISFFFHCGIIKAMKQNFKKVCLYVLQVVLTALASAGIALLQGYLQARGVNAGPTLNIEDTGVIGGVVASGKIAISNLKANCFL